MWCLALLEHTIMKLRQWSADVGSEVDSSWELKTQDTKSCTHSMWQINAECMGHSMQGIVN